MKKSTRILQVIYGSLIGGTTTAITFFSAAYWIGLGLTYILFTLMGIHGSSNFEDFLLIILFWKPAVLLGLIGGLVVSLLHPKHKGWPILTLKSYLCGIAVTLIMSFIVSGIVIKGWIEAVK